MDDKDTVYLGVDAAGWPRALSRKRIRDQLTRFGVGGWVVLEDDGKTPDDMFEAVLKVWREEAMRVGVTIHVAQDETRTKTWTF